MLFLLYLYVVNRTVWNAIWEIFSKLLTFGNLFHEPLGEENISLILLQQVPNFQKCTWEIYPKLPSQTGDY